MPRSPVKVEEIRHRAEHGAVDNVPHRAADNKAAGHQQKRPVQLAQVQLEQQEQPALQELQLEQLAVLEQREQLALLAKQARKELLYHSKEALQLLVICQQVATL